MKWNFSKKWTQLDEKISGFLIDYTLPESKNNVRLRAIHFVPFPSQKDSSYC